MGPAAATALTGPGVGRNRPKSEFPSSPHAAWPHSRSHRPPDVTLAAQRVAGHFVRHDDPRPHSGRVPGHERHHRALGAYAAMDIRNAGFLVDKTFDESLMSINYARAAATDFAAMRAAFARRWIATDPQMRTALDEQTDKLNATPCRRYQDRQAALAIGSRRRRRRQGAERGGRLEERLRAAARRHQARRQLGHTRPLRRQGRRADRSFGQLHRRRRFPLSVRPPAPRSRTTCSSTLPALRCTPAFRAGGGRPGASHRRPGRGRLQRRRAHSRRQARCRGAAGGRRRAWRAARRHGRHARQHQDHDGPRGRTAPLGAGAVSPMRWNAPRKASSWSTPTTPSCSPMRRPRDFSRRLAEPAQARHAACAAANRSCGGRSMPARC